MLLRLHAMNKVFSIILLIEIKRNLSNGVSKLSPWENHTNRVRDLNIEKCKNFLVLSQYRNYGILNKNTCSGKSINSLPTRLSDEPII